MIADKCQNAPHYMMAKAWTKALDFINSMPPEIKDGRYEIDGDTIYAMVMSYTSIHPSEGKLEAHRKYADIQVILSGEERIDVTDTTALTVSDAYLEDKDLVFFKAPKSLSSQIILRPNNFAFFLPQDAHMPMLCTDQPAPVKKVVIKIAVSSLHT